MCKTYKNTWKSLRKSVWENGEKFSPFLLCCSVYDLMLWNVFGFHIIFHSKINTFYTWSLFGFNLFGRWFYTVST